MKLTLAQARSMKDVVAAKAVPWITTPDQAMAWGVAFGLDKEIEKVLSRSMVDENRLSDPDATTLLLHPWQPAWYVGAPYSGASGHASTAASSQRRASPTPAPSLPPSGPSPARPPRQRAAARDRAAVSVAAASVGAAEAAAEAPGGGF
jgi:hypothetical protein